MAVVSDIELRIRADIARLQNDMNAARRAVDNGLGAVTQAANRARAALSGLAAGFGAQQLSHMVDEYTKFTAQLKLATSSTQEYAQAYSDVKRVSAEASQSLTETGTLYARIANGTKQLGINQKKVADITETVNLSLAVSGASAQEAASAQLQLSQAFASGVLRGEEFNAVNEAAPRLMLALADGIGVPVGALRKMAEQGELTSKVLAVALPRSLDTLREEVKKVQTISGAFTVLKNNVTEFVGQTAETSNTVAVVSGALKVLADNLQLVAGAALTFVAVKIITFLNSLVTSTVATVTANRAAAAAALATAEANAAAATRASLLANVYLAEARASTLAAVGNEQLAFTTNTLIPAQARATAAAEAQSASMAALAIAQRGASTASAATSTVIAALGGPIGALVTVLGLAATAWSIYKSSQDEATRDAEAKVGKSTDQIIFKLDQETKKLRERIQLQKEMNGAPLSGDEEANSRQAEILTKINELKAKGNQLTASEGIDLASYQGIYNGITQAIEENNKAKADSDAVGQSAKDLIEVREKLTGVSKAYRDELTKLQTAYEKGALSQEEYVKLVKQLATETYNNSTAGKQYAKSLDATESSIRRRAEAQQFANQQDQLQLDFLRRTAQVSDAAAIAKSAQIDIEGLKARRTELQGLLGVEQKRTDTQAKQIELSGQIKNINDQIAARKTKQDQEQFELEQKLYREAVNNTADLIEAAQAEAKAQKDRTRDMQDEIELLGLTGKQIAEVTAARLRDQAAALDRRAEIGSIEEVNDALRAQAEELRKQADLGLTKERVQEQQKFWGDIEQTAHDTFVSIADGGKGAFQRLKDSAKNIFFEWLYQMTLKKWIVNIGASTDGVAATAGLVSGGGGGSSLLNAASNIGSLYKSITGLASGNLGTGFLGSLVGGLNGAGAGAPLGSALGVQIGNTIANTLGPTLSGALSTGISGLATALPWVGGAVAVYSLAKAAFGMGPKQYADSSTLTGTLGAGGFSGSVNTAWTQKGGWLRSNKSGTDKAAVDAVLASGLASTYDAIKTATKGYADVLGLNAASIADRTQTLNIALGKDEAANQKAIADFFTGVSDTIATEVLPSISQFQASGENAGATLQRLATDFAGVNALMEKVGIDLGRAFKDTGVAAIAARERIVSLAGGLDALGTQLDFYYSNFLAAAERIQPLQKQITDQLATLGVPWIKSAADYRLAVEHLVNSGEAATESGAALYTGLLKLAPAFKSMTDAVKELNQAAVDRAFAALSRAVNAQKDVVTEAYNDAMAVLDSRITGLNDTISRTTELSQELKRSFQGIDTPQAAGYARQAAQAQITAFLAIARAGGALPSTSDIQSAVSALSNDASGQYSTLADYQRDVARTNNELEQLGVLTDGQLSAAQQQLAVLQDQKTIAQTAYEAEIARLDSLGVKAQAQLDAINGVDTSVKTVAEALAEVNVALLALNGPYGTPAAPIIGGASVLSGILSKVYTQAVPIAEDISSVSYGTMSSTSVDVANIMERLLAMEESMAATARATEKFADQFNQVSEGGNSLRTVPA